MAESDSGTSVDEVYKRYKKEGRIWGEVPKERIKKIKFPRVDEEIRQGFLKLDDITPTVSDILDSHGLDKTVAASNIPPLSTKSKLAGTAVTVRNVPEEKTTTQGYVDEDSIGFTSREAQYLAEPGDVFVSDAGGDVETSNMGEQSVTTAMQEGLSGAIVDGAIRDVNSIRKADFPVWAKGRTPKTGKFRHKTIEINGPVKVHDVLVEPGEFVVADDSGICFIPHDMVEDVLEEAVAIEEDEEKMRQMIEDGLSIEELKPHFRSRYD